MVRKLTISYRGLDYAGWQRQDNALTVQQVVEEALSELAGQDLIVVAASRTDAGVHARGQVAHLVGADHLPDRALVHGVNRLLPEDVRILEAARVADGFHARKHAASKLYSYRMVKEEVVSPLDRPFAVKVDGGIDVEEMNEGCRLLEGEHDFSAFALAGGSHTSPVRRILEASCEEDESGIWFKVRGTGFLRGMVRSLVGTLIEVGAGKRSRRELGELLQGASRSEAGPTAPACGLTLERVFYADSWTVETVQATNGPVVD